MHCRRLMRLPACGNRVCIDRTRVWPNFAKQCGNPCRAGFNARQLCVQMKAMLELAVGNDQKQVVCPHPLPWQRDRLRVAAARYTTSRRPSHHAVRGKSRAASVGARIRASVREASAAAFVATSG